MNASVPSRIAKRSQRAKQSPSPLCAITELSFFEWDELLRDYLPRVNAPYTVKGALRSWEWLQSGQMLGVAVRHRERVKGFALAHLEPSLRAGCSVTCMDAFFTAVDSPRSVIAQQLIEALWDEGRTLGAARLEWRTDSSGPLPSEVSDVFRPVQASTCYEWVRF